jgi:hypothetical protein
MVSSRGCVGGAFWILVAPIVGPQASPACPVAATLLPGGADWTVYGGQSDASAGFSVASAGDVNGDGFDDVVVGTIYYDGGQMDEGRASVYMGSPTGLAPSPAWEVAGGQANVMFGGWVASAGDVDGDGFGDLIVGARGGRAFVYMGSAQGLATSPDWTMDGTGNYTPVSSAGDVNADGFDDVLVGAPHDPHGGNAFLFLGSAGGLASNAAWVGTCNQDDALYGWPVAGAGDVNGDGFDDVIVGSQYFDGEGAAFLYLGSSSGLSATADWTMKSGQTGSLFGRNLSAAGDVNGDGFDDVIIGAPLYDNQNNAEGRAVVYLGSATGLETTPIWSAESNQDNGQMGNAVSSGGDLTGDGFAEVIVAAFVYDGGQVDEGRISIFRGGPAGPESAPFWIEEGSQVRARFGASVACAGDVNGDGFSEVLAGADLYDHWFTNEGAAFLYMDVGCSEVGTSYCQAGLSSAGIGRISAWCSASAGEGRMMLLATPVPNQNGIFFHGANQAELPFGNGYLCTTGGLVRGTIAKATGKLAKYRYDNTDDRHALSAFVGSTRHFQYWFRDPQGGGAQFNTTDARSITILP